MSKKIYKVLSLLLCFLLIFEQSGFAQMAGQLDISGYLAGLRNALTQDKFRPLHLRYLSYDTLNNNFKLLLDKGDLKDVKAPQVAETTQKLLEYFFVGVSLPNSSFWVNLRPDSPDNIIDPCLAQTDAGKILLEADLQLKKDTAKYTSPENPKGKEYWEKLYKKAGELFGYDNITIPTLTRPWIVPDEIIVREANDNAYIYKATLKVQLEQDHLKDSAVYNFDDPRLKELNEYSSQLIRELIIPELTKEINISKRYAPLRQVYYSLILAQWFKQKFNSKGGFYSSLIDRQNLNGITSKEDWSKTTYFREYQKSFQKGEYNIQQPIYTSFGQTIRSYFSGGVDFGVTKGEGGVLATAMQKGSVQAATPGGILAGNSHTLPVDVDKGGTSDNVGVDIGAIQVGKTEEVSSPLISPVPKRTPAPSKILLINIVDKDRLNTPTYPIGLYTLKTYMQTNYSDRAQVEIRDTQLDDLDNIIKFVKTWGPQILGLSVKTENTAILDQFMQQLDISMPEGARPLCVIGRQAAAFGYRDLLERYPNAVCVRGEGELALAGLSEFVQGKKNLQDIKNIAYIEQNTGSLRETERALLPNFESIGVVDHSDLARYIEVGGNAWMESSRGCPWGACRFCSISEFWGKARQRREKTVDMIIAELKQFKAMGIERFTFSDEEFIGFGIEGVKRARRIAQAIIDSGIKISFHTDMRAASIWNKSDTPEERQLRIETLKLLKEAGLKTVFIGLETGSPEQLERYNKGSEIETAEEAIKICKELGINMALGFIMIDPLVSKQEILESIAFIRRNQILPYLSVPLNRLRIYFGEPYIRLIRAEETRLRRRLISDKFDRETLTYKVEDYKYPAVRTIVGLVTRYAEIEYDLYNAIRWFERFDPRIFGVQQMDAYTYLKEAAERSKEYQVEFLYQLASLTDEDLLQTHKPQQIFTEAITKRDKFIRELEQEILRKGHTKECDSILQQIKKYFVPESPVDTRPPKGTPATLLRYMHDNKIFSDNPKKSSEMALQRGGNDSQRTIQRELQVLRAVGLVNGNGQTGYYLSDELRNTDPEEIIRQNPELSSPGLYKKGEKELPSHWNKDWELPTKVELRRAEEVLEYLTPKDDDGEYRYDPELQGFPLWVYAGKTYVERARTLRAIYYLAPDVAGAFMVSLGFGMHGTWKDLLDPSYAPGESADIETPILAAMVNRGLDIYAKVEFELEYKGKIISTSRTIAGLTGLIGYMSSEVSWGIIERLDANAEFLLVESMANYVIHKQGVYPAAREHIFDLLTKIPPKQIQQFKGKLNKEVREFLVSINKLSLPEVPPLPLVKEAAPRVVGKGVGKLVVLKDEIPNFNTLSNLPEDTIVAMSFLPTSDTRVGPFRGILTFRQEGETSHAQARSRIWGVPHALWPGPESLAELDGKNVVFEVTEKQVNIREATEKDLEIPQQQVAPAQIQFPTARLDGEEYYLGPGNAKLADPQEVGYKVALLNQLASRSPTASDLRIQVSLTTGAALPFRTFTHMLKTGRQTYSFGSLLQDLKNGNERDISHTLREIRDLFDYIQDKRAGFASEELWHQFVMKGEAGEFWRNGIFVRTSTNVENLPAHPGVGAGVYKTESNVIGQYAFWDALKAVWGSVWSEQAFWERRKLGIDETQVFPAVWLVPSIPAKYSFVIHTSSISTQQPKKVVIEVVQGLGESLVGNNPMFAGFPTRIVWDKESQRVVSQTPSTKQRQSILAEAGGTLVEETDPKDEFLNNLDAQRLIKAIVEVGQQTEAFFGQAQEIEGALTYNEENRQWTVSLLQTRFVDAPTSDNKAPPAINNPNDRDIREASSPANPAAGKNPGGVDFHALPIVTQPLTGINMPLTKSDNFRADPEWQEIQNMVNAGIIPSGQRIKDYLQSCCQKKELNGEIGRVLNCIADIMRIEEERVLATNPEFRDMLVLLESGKSTDELKTALNKINFQS